MRRKQIVILVSAVAVVVATLIVLVGWRRSPAQKRPFRSDIPDILFISIDTVRADHLSCYGYRRPTSPSLDRLAADGVRFARAVAQSSFTLPSHVSMFTGWEMGVHGAASASHGLADNATTITEVLRDAGYATVGVASAPFLKRQFGLAQGFEVYDDDLANVSVRRSHQAVTSERAVDRALRYIKERRRQNWFVFVHMWDPHYDYIPPPPFNELFAGGYRGHFSMNDFENDRDFRSGMDPADFDFTVSQYDGEIAWTDSQLGRLFAELKKMGLYDKTAIIVTSDHGEEFLDHGQKGHGHTLFDELVHVPLIVKLPGAPSGKVVDCAVSLLDLFPTFAELARVKKTGLWGSGHSLLDLINGRWAFDPNRELTSETNLACLDKLGKMPRSYEFMLETGDLKFFRRAKDPSREVLFDFRADPGEQRDLLAADPARAETLRRRVLAHLRRDRILRDKLNLSQRIHVDADTTRQLHQLGYTR